MNKARKQNLVVGILICVVGIISFCMTFQMPDIDAYRFPRLVIILFFVLGVFLIGASLRGKYDSADGRAALQLKKIKTPGISLIIVLGYAALISVIGFYTTTTVFLLVFMKFLGAKSWKSMLITIFCVDVFIFFVFTYQFNIPLPAGIAI